MWEWVVVVADVELLLVLFVVGLPETKLLERELNALAACFGEEVWGGKASSMQVVPSSRLLVFVVSIFKVFCKATVSSAVSGRVPFVDDDDDFGLLLSMMRRSWSSSAYGSFIVF